MGRLVPDRGLTLDSATVVLEPDTADAVRSGSRLVGNVYPNGAFFLIDVPAGDYTIRASGRASGSDADLFAAHHVTVDSADVSGIVLTLKSGRPVMTGVQSDSPSVQAASSEEPSRGAPPAAGRIVGTEPPSGERDMAPERGGAVGTIQIGAPSATESPAAAPGAVDSAATTSSPLGSSPTMLATRVAEAPVLDGDVLEDAIWADARPIEGFWQTNPFEGQPASERTEVRAIYTEDTLYFGIVCYDRDPEAIIVADSRRDSPLNETDSFQIILDTFHDTQNGFVFGTNPVGIEYDGQVANEGQGSGGFGGGGGGGGGGRQQRGAGGGFNLNWDGSWRVQTRISEIGWTAEFAIPFRTLRYPVVPVQTWGLNFQRNIRRRNEQSYWAPLPRQYNLYRLSMAGMMTGLEIPAQRNLKVTPYVLGQTLSEGERPRTDIYLGDVGIDAKYSLTPGLTLDATYNTDFAQVEVDELQINLDRFNLFFPEKRPFFLENAGFFAVGNSGDAELFFSRRIGIGPDGESIPIIAGARVSGKLAGMNVGLLNMQTEEFPGAAPGNNFGVVRLSRELANRSSVGGIFVNRQGMGDFAVEDDYNRSFALDGRWGIGEAGLISGFAARTVTPGLEGDEYAYRVNASRNTRSWILNGAYMEVADDFNPEVGFLRRKGYRRLEANTFHRIRPENFMGIQELRPHVNTRFYWDFEGFQETGYVHVDQHWEFRNAYEVHTGMNVTREGLLESFEIFPDVFVPPGTYDHAEAALVFFTNQGAPVSARLNVTAGGFFGGDRLELRPSVSVRLGERLNTSFSLNRNDIDLPGGSFVTNLGVARVSYSFTPRIFTQALVQYNDRADLWSSNLRVGWLQQANTGLFIVYNDTRGLASASDPDLGGRSLTLKYSRLFDVLN